jgi:RNA polymerase sigma-70 factor, ECF subfamily
MDSRWIEIEALVLRAQKGDREAFGELVVRFERSVAALARQRVRDAHEADELVQEVFLHAMRKIGQLRNAACFGAWLRRITVRVAINRGLRKQPVAVAEPMVLESATRPGSEPLDDLVREERRRKVRDAVAKLKPIDRDALAAFYLRGRSLLEIAEEFDVPVGTVKRRLHTARRRLQGSLGGTGYAGDFGGERGLGATGSASASNGKETFSSATGSASASGKGFQNAEAPPPRKLKRQREFALAE